MSEAQMNSLPFLQAGDVFETRAGEVVNALVPEHMVITNKRGSWKVVRYVVKISQALDHLIGHFIVTKTEMDGGGTTGHGPDDVYPDGHHVWAQRADDPSITIDFYQSGWFMHKWDRMPEVVGHASRVWVWTATGVTGD